MNQIGSRNAQYIDIGIQCIEKKFYFQNIDVPIDQYFKSICSTQFEQFILYLYINVHFNVCVFLNKYAMIILQNELEFKKQIKFRRLKCFSLHVDIPQHDTDIYKFFCFCFICLYRD